MQGQTTNRTRDVKTDNKPNAGRKPSNKNEAENTTEAVRPAS